MYRVFDESREVLRYNRREIVVLMTTDRSNWVLTNYKTNFLRNLLLVVTVRNGNILGL